MQPHLTFDRQIDDGQINYERYNLRMKMKPDKTKEEELERVNAKPKKKYRNLIASIVHFDFCTPKRIK
jgi:hypothetical protein